MGPGALKASKELAAVRISPLLGSLLSMYFSVSLRGSKPFPLVSLVFVEVKASLKGTSVVVDHVTNFPLNECRAIILFLCLLFRVLPSPSLSQLKRD